MTAVASPAARARRIAVSVRSVDARIDELAGPHLVRRLAHQVEVDLGRELLARHPGGGELGVTLRGAEGDDEGVDVGDRAEMVRERADDDRHGLVEVGADGGDRVEALLSQPPPPQYVVALAHRAGFGSPWLP